MLIYGWGPGKAPAGWVWRWSGAAREGVGRLPSVWSACATDSGLGRAARGSRELVSARLSLCFNADWLLERSSNFQSSLSIKSVSFLLGQWKWDFEAARGLSPWATLSAQEPQLSWVSAICYVQNPVDRGNTTCFWTRQCDSNRVPLNSSHRNGFLNAVTFIDEKGRGRKWKEEGEDEEKH